MHSAHAETSAQAFDQSMLGHGACRPGRGAGSKQQTGRLGDERQQNSGLDGQPCRGPRQGDAFDASEQRVQDAFSLMHRIDEADPGLRRLTMQMHEMQPDLPQLHLTLPELPNE